MVSKSVGSSQFKQVFDAFDRSDAIKPARRRDQNEQHAIKRATRDQYESRGASKRALATSGSAHVVAGHDTGLLLHNIQLVKKQSSLRV